MPGYDEWTWCRVQRCSVAQDEETQERYTFTLELSPQAVPLAPLQFKWADWGAPGQIVFDTAPTPGNVLLAALFASNSANPVMFTSGYTSLVMANAHGNQWGVAVRFLTKTVGVGESATQTASGTRTALGVWEFPAGTSFDAVGTVDYQLTSTMPYVGPTGAASADTMFITGFVGCLKDFQDGGNTYDIVARAPATVDGNDVHFGSEHEACSLSHLDIATAGTYGIIADASPGVGDTEVGWCSAAVVVMAP
jgi:hypothetical protein